MFNSVPTPRPGLSPRMSNLTRLEDLDAEEEVMSSDKVNDGSNGDSGDVHRNNKVSGAANGVTEVKSHPYASLCPLNLDMYLLIHIKPKYSNPILKPFEV